MTFLKLMEIWPICPGQFGVVCILMEEDNLSDGSAVAGYNAFCSTFESKMNEFINSRTIGDLQNSATPDGEEKDKLFRQGLKNLVLPGFAWVT
jgi:hypothetical protein